MPIEYVISEAGCFCNGEKEEQVTCECVRCAECNGSGSVWFSFDGKRYLGTHRWDDLDELETCEQCGGSGITERCWECADEERDDDL